MSKFLILILNLIICYYFTITEAINTDHLNGPSDDRNALLIFLAGVTKDPDNTLAQWGSPNSDMCNWIGVKCYPTEHRVMQLNLSGRNLTGVISPALANLSSLAMLDLSSNNFVGGIPKELGALSRLTHLKLATNYLVGPILPSLGFLQQLLYLDLDTNNLDSSIPETIFCNCTSLQYIDLSDNYLYGKIAYGDQCKLKDLQFLQLYRNNLEGSIPRSLSNSSKLKWIDLASNHLTGELPSDIFNKMPYLEKLRLSHNNLSSFSANTKLDAFFTSLSNSSNLQVLELARTSLRSEIPSSIGDLPLGLQRLVLDENVLHGPIPANISSLVELAYLDLSKNSLNGSIPPDISKLRMLESLFLSKNLLSGEIPSSLGEIPRLGVLDLSENILSGSIPHTFSNNLWKLWLHNNKLSGSISSLVNCTNLDILDLSHNHLTGGIPNNLAGLSRFKQYLNLSSNSLSDPLPIEFGKMEMVSAMDLSSNNFSGSIPSQLRNCKALEYLNLTMNSFQGLLPDSIGALPNLKTLDVSSNKLQGALPKSLQASSTLKQLNLSFNNFSGAIPSEGVFTSLSKDSFLGNPELCGSILQMPSCTSVTTHHFIFLPILLALIIPSSFVICFFGYPLISRTRRKSQALVFQISMTRDDEEQSKRDYPRISYRELVEATGDFSDSNLIGAGTFGQVYRGILSNEMRIAVKVLNVKIGEREISGSFKRECDVLKMTRHRNLIKIITTCSKPDFKALVLPLMPNGNLDSHLYPSDASSCSLSLVQLVSIASDVAEGIAYLHHYSPVRVVHCDLKPSNVLLDEGMTAVVSDFGIAKLVKGGDDDENSGNITDPASCISTTCLLHGSVGYIAPEYGLGGRPSTRGDVYSFGILLLEIITGKRPTDVIFHEGLTLQEWVKRHLTRNIEPLISRTCNSIDWSSAKNLWRDVMVEIIELGLVCSQFTPAMRPTMIDAAHEIALLKQELLTHA